MCESYGDRVKFRAYQMGKDTEYLEKYGFMSRGTMIINGTRFIDRLSRGNIEKEIAEAVGEVER